MLSIKYNYIIMCVREHTHTHTYTDTTIRTEMLRRRCCFSREFMGHYVIIDALTEDINRRRVYVRG